MGFSMGDEDRPFSERQWGLGRRLSPTIRGRQVLMVLLVGTFGLIVVGVLFALVTGSF